MKNKRILAYIFQNITIIQIIFFILSFNFAYAVVIST